MFSSKLNLNLNDIFNNNSQLEDDSINSEAKKNKEEPKSNDEADDSKIDDDAVYKHIYIFNIKEQGRALFRSMIYTIIIEVCCCCCFFSHC